MATANDIRHDVFVSYAHPDDAPIVGAEGWVTTLVRNLQSFLARRLGRAEAYSIWMDRRLDLNTPIAHAITENLEQSATLLVVLSPAYLDSAWCRREANHFLETIRRSRTSDGRVFVVEMLPTDRELWPAEFRDVISVRLWEQTDSGAVRTLGFPQPSRSDQAYFSALDRLANGIAAVIQKIRQFLIGSDQPSGPSTQGPQGGDLVLPVEAPRLSSELDQRREAGDYDVFLCHNTEDKSEVKAIGRLLIGENILP